MLGMGLLGYLLSCTGNFFGIIKPMLVITVRLFEDLPLLVLFRAVRHGQNLWGWSEFKHCIL